jgi:hypothetical protein
MVKYARAACAAVALVGLVMTVPVGAADKAGLEAKEAFARLKTLAGEWKAEGECSGMCQDGKISYRVTANGSVVMETLFPGSDHEMISMYFLDQDELRMTHYCAAKNQPRMKLDRQASKPDELVFVFDGGTNLDPEKDMHVHSGRISFRSEGRVESEWDAYQGGKKVQTAKIVLTKP